LRVSFGAGKYLAPLCCRVWDVEKMELCISHGALIDATDHQLSALGLTVVAGAYTQLFGELHNLLAFTTKPTCLQHRCIVYVQKVILRVLGHTHQALCFTLCLDTR